jgi:hypothetical protein
MVSNTDAETLRILDDVVVLAVHANPDGMELVSNWYYNSDGRGGTPEDRSYGGLPVLYHKYAGHDNNRDFYMGNLSETTNMLRVQYREWFPQIIYNHHQTGPQGTIMFAPPFRNPPNHFLDPLIMTSLDQVGSAMHHRFVQEGKGGTTMRSGASYSIWWNGGLRTTPYFHNAIGLLTETRGSPNPLEIPFVPQRQLATTDLPLPVEPGLLHFRTVIEYSQTANWAVMDYASRNKDMLLFNIWRMGMNSIEKGEEDSWTVRPSEIYAAAEELGGLGASGSPTDYNRFLHDPEKRDPRGFILPSDQSDFPTAVQFVNTLIKNGVRVHRATSGFSVGGEHFPEGSLVVKADQAYRPHVLDMFEPQDHPNDFAYPGGPPIAPYDATGWTLAFQMGVKFDRILDGFDGPFEKIEGSAEAPEGAVSNAQGARGFLLSHDYVDGFVVVNRLMESGEDIYWLTQTVTIDGNQYPAGTVYIRSRGGTQARLQQMATELGVDFEGVSSMPRTEALQLDDVRVGLWDQYGGSIGSGWTRWLLEQFEFPFEVVYPPRLDEGNLKRNFDVLIFPDGAIPEEVARADDDPYSTQNFDPSTIPEEYRDRLGQVSTDVTVPQLRRFLEEGGTIITIGSSGSLAMHLGLPVGDHLVDASGNPLPAEEYFIPGSILQARVDNSTPLAYGFEDHVDMMFNRSPVFRLESGTGTQGVHRVAWYDSATPLRSGWAWGQEHVQNGLAAIEAGVGDGKLYMFGPEVLYRGQPHETFKFVFNGIYLSTAREATAN